MATELESLQVRYEQSPSPSKALRALPGLIFLWASLGALPFITTVKLPPLPNFWGEWIATLLALTCLVALNVRQTPQRSASVIVPSAVVPFAVLAVLIAIQVTLHRIPSAVTTVFPIGELIVAGAMACAGASILEKDELVSILDAFAWGLVAALVANFLAVVLELFGVQIYLLSFGPGPVPDRAVGLVGQPNQLGVLTAVAWTAAFYLLSRGKLGPKSFWVLSLLAAAVIAATFSRAGIVAWAIGVAIIFLMPESQNEVSRSEAALKTSHRRSRVFAVSVGLFLLVQIAWAIGLRFVAPTNDGLVRSVTPRLELLSSAWKVWQSYPLLGAGFGQFMPTRLIDGTAPMSEPAAAHVHNLVLHLLAEYGLVGAAAVIVTLAFIGRKTWSAARKAGLSPQMLFAVVACAQILFYSLVEYPLWYTYFLFPFAFLLGTLPQRNWTVSVSKGSGKVRAVVWAFAGAACVLVAADYVRLQTIYVDVGRQREAALRNGEGPWTKIPPEIATISLATLFPLYADNMQTRALPPDGFLMEYKIATARRVMLGLPSGESIARYMEFCIVAGDVQEADRWLIMAGQRNQTLFQNAVTVLRAMSKNKPAVAKFLSDNGLA